MPQCQYRSRILIISRSEGTREAAAAGVRVVAVTAVEAAMALSRRLYQPESKQDKTGEISQSHSLLPVSLLGFPMATPGRARALKAELSLLSTELGGADGEGSVKESSVWHTQ